MDYMDIDEVCDVPDTPDRLAAQNINGRGCVEKESNSSVACHKGNADFFNEGAINRPRGKSEMVIDNRQSKRLSFHSGKNLNISNKSESDGDIGNSSLSKNAHLFRRMVSDKPAKHETKKSLHSQCIEKGKAPCTSQSPTHGEHAIVDLTVQSGPAQVCQNAFPSGALEDCQAKEIRKGPISTSGFSSLCGVANSSTAAHTASKGKEKIDDISKGGSGIDHGKGIFGDSQPKADKSMPSSFYSISSPRISGQKRLVRNGCISPHNIAKAKQIADSHSNGSMDARNDKEAPVSDFSLSSIRDLVTEDTDFHRGPRVISRPSSSKERDIKTIDLSTRSSVIHNEVASGTTNAGADVSRGGWRSTRNRTQKIDLPFFDEGPHLPRTKDDLCFVNQHNKNRVLRRHIGIGSGDSISNNDNRNAVSFQHGSGSTVAQEVSNHISQSYQVSGCHAAANTLIKRQKQGSASSNHGESSTSASVDSDIVFIGSSVEPSNSRSTRNQSSHGPGILGSVIEIDEFSPEMRHLGSHNIGGCSNDDSDARAIQLEADEMLARELQEQLYNEGPGVGDGEIDAHLALELLQEETLQHALGGGSHPVFNPSGSLFSNFNRQSQSRSTQNPSIRRGTHTRGPGSARLTRLRSRLPNQLPRIPYRARSSLFPPNMDLDTRIDILEALESFSDMGMSDNFLQVRREFNENDYEMLLALDENNHQHGGASLVQVNRLPESTVQGDNFEEDCAICLETPTSGDTIRHLPCLHKFHKACIDPWLRRRSSCPVCKSSIT